MHFPPNRLRFSIWRARKHDEAFELYRWFLPLLRMDTVPKFVQLIKWVQEQVGVGSARVRPPRLELEGDELTEAQRTLQKALAGASSSVGGQPWSARVSDALALAGVSLIAGRAGDRHEETFRAYQPADGRATGSLLLLRE